MNYKESKNCKYIDLIYCLKKIRKDPVVSWEDIADVIVRTFSQGELERLLKYINEIKNGRYGRTS